MISRFGSQTALEVRRLADPRVVVIAWRTVSDVYGGSNSVSVFTTATTVVQVGGGRCRRAVRRRRVASRASVHSGLRLASIFAACVFSPPPAAAAFAQVQPMPSSTVQLETRATDPCCG